jgi:nitrate/nitrite transporter NarK
LFGSFGTLGLLLTPICVEYFGTQAIGVIVGAVTFASDIGDAISPSLSGWIFDITGEYRIAFLVCSIVILGMIVTMWLLKPSSGKSENIAYKAGV